MRPSRIIVLRQTTKEVTLPARTTIVDSQTLRSWVRRGTILKHLFRYREARGLTYDLNVMIRPLLFAILLRSLSYGGCYITDEQGRRRPVTVGFLIRGFTNLAQEFFRRKELLCQAWLEVEQLEKVSNVSRPGGLDLSAGPVYLRTDLVFGLCSGGSVGHIAGVLNRLDEFAGKPVFLTSDWIPTVRPGIETYRVVPSQRFWDFAELPTLAYNDTFLQIAQSYLNGRAVSFVYQRYSLNNYAGVRLARELQAPFVLEYNGSEVWINRHWGKPLKYESLSERIEFLNLQAADLVVVVSQPMKDELMARGIGPAKILVNPNGVDPKRYSPEIDGSKIRYKYGLNGKIVVGFIGTFGPWHGAEVLAEAFGCLLQGFPEYRERVRLLMIGNGMTMPRVKETLAKYDVEGACVLTGQVLQEQGPKHLSACDILVASHVPNPDGTAFFGSPTKLFEYMAMGKGIVASDLDQIGEVLEHKRTAWMVEPGDAQSLVLGIKTLIGDKQLRHRLGEAARRQVVAKYTWQEHTRRIIEKLRECCGRK